MLFADYLVQWLEIAKSTVKLTTYASYASKVSSAEAMLNGLGMGSNPGNDT